MEYPELKHHGRKPQLIDIITEERILESCRTSILGPTHLGKKIEEKNGIHAFYNTISVEKV